MISVRIFLIFLFATPASSALGEGFQGFEWTSEGPSLDGLEILAANTPEFESFETYSQPSLGALPPTTVMPPEFVGRVSSVSSLPTLEFRGCPACKPLSAVAHTADFKVQSLVNEHLDVRMGGIDSEAYRNNNRYRVDGVDNVFTFNARRFPQPFEIAAPSGMLKGEADQGFGLIGIDRSYSTESAQGIYFAGLATDADYDGAGNWITAELSVGAYRAIDLNGVRLSIQGDYGIGAAEFSDSSGADDMPFTQSAKVLFQATRLTRLPNGLSTRTAAYVGAGSKYTSQFLLPSINQPAQIDVFAQAGASFRAQTNRDWQQGNLFFSISADYQTGDVNVRSNLGARAKPVQELLTEVSLGWGLIIPDSQRISAQAIAGTGTGQSDILLALTLDFERRF